MSVVCPERPTFDDATLQQQIMDLRVVDNVRNLLYLAGEYICLAVVIGSAIGFEELRGSWGLSWGWDVPVFALAIILIGGLQHRLAGLGHEASHYSFMKNRFLNDLIPDLFCMFPLLTTVHFYRVFHMAHHQYTNDPERDPDILNLGRGKRIFEFPMTRARFVAVVYFCMVVAPLRFAQYQWAYFVVNALGKGRSVYVGTDRRGGIRALYLPRLGTLLGLLYLLTVTAIFWGYTRLDVPQWIVPTGLLGLAIAGLVTYSLPDWAIFQSPFRQVYSARFAGVVRLGSFTALLAVLALIRWKTSGRFSLYPTLLWVVPLLSSFPFFMYLRDVYQHSNADSGRLTNSRVFYTDAFTRWAVFVYGQDMHVPHHLFPAIPHYRLPQLHEILKRHHGRYRDQVTECHGTFHDSLGRITILDEMTRNA